MPPPRAKGRKKAARGGADAALVKRALAAIKENDGRFLSVPDVVDALAVNRRRLERAFEAEDAGSLLDAVNEERIRRVERFLRETDYPLSAIASECGFSSASYLVAAYRRHRGKTPTQFRTAAV